MLHKLNIASIYVLDKDGALDFYVDELGLEDQIDFTQGETRSLTVRVPGQPDSINLEQPARSCTTKQPAQPAPQADHEGRTERPRLPH